MKPLRSSHTSSAVTYNDNAIIPYIKDIKGISRKFTLIGNCFIVSTIFKTKHALCGTLMKTGQLEITSSMCKISRVIVADVTSLRQADL
jgi:hypothetical protein